MRKKPWATERRRSCRNARQQRGDVLLDALVAMLLASIIGLGPAYVAARSTVVQTQGGMQNLAAVQMRNLLSQQGVALCDTTPNIDVGNQTLSVTVECESRSADAVTVEGAAITMDGTATNRITLSVSSQPLFGGAGTITVVQ